MSTHILILDDEPVIVHTYCAILAQGGYTTKGVGTHEDAVRLAREFRPDVFITGFNNVGNKNGCETAAEILEFLPQCRVVICSGNPDRAVWADYERRGYAFEFQTKPVDFVELFGMLRAGRPSQ